MNYRQSPQKTGLSLVITLLVVGLILFIGLRIAKGIFSILSWLAPILLLIALVVNYKVVVNYGKWLWRLLKNRTLYGIVASILTIILFPIVAAWLCFRAILGRRIQKAMGNNKRPARPLDDYADYEVIDSEIKKEKRLRE